MTPTDQRMARAFRVQIHFCENGEAPFTADLLRALADDFADGGAWRSLLGDWPVDPEMDAVPLRAVGALHRLALMGVEPFKGLFDRLDRAPAALADAVLKAGDWPQMGQWLKNPPQTNEVGRSALFLGGFFEVARAQGLPLRLLEMGCSGGLNLLWDRYHYRLGDTEWGPRDSPVGGDPPRGGPKPPPAAREVLSRRGGVVLTGGWFLFLG